MERSFRFRVSGLLFFIVLSLHLISANALSPIFASQLPQELSLTIIQVLGAAIIAVFASDAIGFIFSSIAVLIFNSRGGYSGEYERRLGYRDLKQGILRDYSSIAMPQDVTFPAAAFEARMQEYNTEHFLVYFLWHRPDLTDRLNEWVERRHTAYFTAYSAGIAIVTGTVAALVTISCARLDAGVGNLWILVGSVLFLFIVARNGSLAMRDALAIIDLRVAGFLNPRIRSLVERYRPASHQEPKPAA